MSFTRAKPPGWVQGDKLTPTQINHIDVNQSRAIDGTGGGLYTPVAPVRIDGLYPNGLHVEDLLAQRARITEGPLDFNGILSPSDHGIGYRLRHLTLPTGALEVGCDRDVYTVDSFGGPVPHYLDLSHTSPIPERGEVIRVCLNRGLGTWMYVRDGAGGPQITRLTSEPIGGDDQKTPAWCDCMWDNLASAWVIVAGYTYL